MTEPDPFAYDFSRALDAFPANVRRREICGLCGERVDEADRAGFQEGWALHARCAANRSSSS